MAVAFLNKLHRLAERDSIGSHTIFAILGLGATFSLPVLTYFRCKIWRHILAWRPRFPIKPIKY